MQLNESTDELFSLSSTQDHHNLTLVCSPTVTMLGVSRDRLVPVHEPDLRQHRSLPSRIGTTRIRFSRAIFDADVCHRSASRLARNGIGPVPGSRCSAWLESFSFLQGRVYHWSHWLMAGNSLDLDANVSCPALHWADVVQLCAIQAVPFEGFC